MPRTPEDLEPRDVAQWYKHAWVDVDGFDGPRLVTGVCVDTGAVRHTSGVPHERVATSDKTRVTGVWPRLGSVNVHSGFAAYVERLPLKIYRRSFNEEGVRVSVPNRWAVSKAMFAPGLHTEFGFTHGRALANAVWAPVYVERSAAMLQILNGERVSAAVSRRIILCNAASSDKVGVWFCGKLVGYLSGGGEFWSCGDVVPALALAGVCKELGI